MGSFPLAPPLIDIDGEVVKTRVQRIGTWIAPQHYSIKPGRYKAMPGNMIRSMAMIHITPT